MVRNMRRDLFGIIKGKIKVKGYCELINKKIDIFEENEKLII